MLTVRRYLIWERRSQRISLKEVTQKALKRERCGISVACCCDCCGSKFGKIPAAMVKQIEATERIDLLEAWFDQALAAKKLEELSFTDG
jgi:hypothetical protein